MVRENSHFNSLLISLKDYLHVARSFSPDAFNHPSNLHRRRIIKIEQLAWININLCCRVDSKHTLYPVIADMKTYPEEHHHTILQHVHFVFFEFFWRAPDGYWKITVDVFRKIKLWFWKDA